MRGPKYKVDLTDEGRGQLLLLVRQGKSSHLEVIWARILLEADEGRNNHQIAEACNISLMAVSHTRRRFVERGLDGAVSEQMRCGGIRKLNGTLEAQITSLASSNPPEGHSRWTMRLLARKVVELGFTESISRETIRLLLKKRTHALKETWACFQGMYLSTSSSG